MQLPAPSLRLLLLGSPKSANGDVVIGTYVYPTRLALLANIVRQRLFSVPHYLQELAELRRPRDLYAWTYYKWPRPFPLAPFPPYVTVEVTNACNLACRHCWRSTMQRPVGYITTELFRDIVAQIEHHCPATLKLTGMGEVALHPRFQDLMSVLSLSNPGIRVYMYTNGLLLRKFSHRRILDWNVHTLVVSVDGTDQESYNCVRAGGDYHTLRREVEGFHALREAMDRKRPRIEIRHVMMPDESAKQLLDFRKRWLVFADTVKFNYLVPLQKFVDPIANDKGDTSLHTSCRHIRREFCIEWDGRVRLCGIYPAYVGDLHSSSIKELWHSSTANFVRDCQNRRDFDQIPVCRNCPFT